VARRQIHIPKGDEVGAKAREGRGKMRSNIPPRGCIPPHIRKGRQGQLKIIDNTHKMTPGTGIHIGIGGNNKLMTKRSSPSSNLYRIQGKPIVVNRASGGTLEKLLTWGRQEEQKCINLLHVLSPELSEYTQVLERLSKLQDVIEQVKRQLAARR